MKRTSIQKDHEPYLSTLLRDKKGKKKKGKHINFQESSKSYFIIIVGHPSASWLPEISIFGTGFPQNIIFRSYHREFTTLM